MRCGESCALGKQKKRHSWAQKDTKGNAVHMGAHVPTLGQETDIVSIVADFGTLSGYGELGTWMQNTWRCWDGRWGNQRHEGERWMAWGCCE